MKKSPKAAWAAGTALLVGGTLAVPPPAFGMGKKPRPVPAQLSGKRVIRLNPVRNVRIEMPDQKYHDFGQDFAQRIENDLYASGRYVIDVPPVHGAEATFGARALRRDGGPPSYEWPGSQVPAASLSIKVEAMSFQTGARGDRMFYGFNERFRTPFNDGFTDLPNEFPLREISFVPNWFDTAFDARGGEPFGSQAGLDLGDGFSVDVLFAWLAVKYAVYHAELHLRLDIDAPLAGLREYRMITVTGEGYFFDIAGAYEGYSLGISVARRDAMAYALSNAIAGTYAAIDRAVAPLPLTGRIDGVADDGTVLLGSGKDAAIKPGTRYELIGHPETQLEAILSNSSGTLCKVAQGDPKLVVPGKLVREAVAGLAPPNDGGARMLAQARAEGLQSLDAGGTPAAVESISLPWNNIPKSDLTALAPSVSWLQAFWKSLVEAVFLPYRIYRYFQYDQAYKGALASVDDQGRSTDNSEASDQGSWPQAARATAWARQIGLDQAPPMTSQGAPVIAVIDSGVDYNHWSVHDHLWFNPAPVDLGAGGPADRKDYYGWDFVSGDAHPYDDGYHGTEIASLLAAVAPVSKLMPLKVFNPWGITSSAAIYGAFQYAVDHGAKIIVCGWATRQASQAIEQGVAYARAAGVAVVAAAGDRGDALAQVAAYPAALSGRYDNVLAVAGVTTDDKLVQAYGAYSNYDPHLVTMSAPGEDITVSTPRSQQTRDTSSGLAAAIAGGALARLVAASEPGIVAQGPAAWIQLLRAEADSLPALDGAVAGGLRLRVRH